MKRFLLGSVALGIFLRSPGTVKADHIFTTIDPPGSIQTNAFGCGINNSGQIAGHYLLGAITHGYVYDPSTDNYTTLDVPGSTSTFANGINDIGQIVGRYSVGGTHGFVLSEGNFTTLDVAGATTTQARSINSAGQISGWFVADGQTHGYILKNGIYTTLDVPDSIYTNCQGINSAGQIVGRFVDSGGTTHGFVRISDGSYTTIDAPGSTLTSVFGINDAGQIVGAYDDAGGVRHGFLLSDGIYTTFDVPGSIYTNPFGINGSGQIVGSYQDLGGTYHGFLATPIPALLITVAPTAIAGTPFDVTVTSLDPSGNIDTAYQGTVTFSTSDSDPGVVLPPDYRFTTGVGGDNGVHTFSGGVTLITVGDQTLTLTDTASGIAGSATITVGPGP
jgi:probable HAF family extracellular repeat protein